MWLQIYVHFVYSILPSTQFMTHPLRMWCNPSPPVETRTCSCRLSSVACAAAAAACASLVAVAAASRCACNTVGGTMSVGTPLLVHVQAVLAHSLYAPALIVPTKA